MGEVYSVRSKNLQKQKNVHAVMACTFTNISFIYNYCTTLIFNVAYFTFSFPNDNIYIPVPLISDGSDI